MKTQQNRFLLTHFILADEADTLHAGKQFASSCTAFIDEENSAIIVYLIGDLGAGKTTFCRGFLRGLNFQGSVKSPTYTLVEPYALPSGNVYHFDLYRLSDSEELEYMGIRDYFETRSVCLIEWPERAQDRLPCPDVTVHLTYVSAHRQLTMNASTERGKRILSSFDINATRHSR